MQTERQNCADRQVLTDKHVLTDQASDGHHERNRPSREIPLMTTDRAGTFLYCIAKRASRERSWATELAGVGS